jgi:hypothetical protein
MLSLNVVLKRNGNDDRKEMVPYRSVVLEAKVAGMERERCSFKNPTPIQITD